MTDERIDELMEDLQLADLALNRARSNFDLSNRAYVAAKRRRELVCSELALLQQGKLKFTDHALLRYFERELKVPTGSIKRILQERIYALSETGEDGHYPINEELVAVVKDQMVITVMPINKLNNLT